MALEARIEELRSRHKHLEAQLDDEMKRPAFDDTRIQSMKRAKLRLKDEIELLSRRH